MFNKGSVIHMTNIRTRLGTSLMIAAPLACALVDQAILAAAADVEASSPGSEEQKPLNLAFLIPHHRVTGEPLRQRSREVTW
jgi:hypothetical protein